MVCKDEVLPKQFLNKCTINSFPFEANTSQPYNENLCHFRAPAPHLHVTQRLEEETSKLLNFIINKIDVLSADQFQGGHMNDSPIVEDLLTLNILLYDIDIVGGKIMGELVRRSVQKNENTVRLLRYNCHICYVNNIKAVFQSFRCPNCDTFSNRTCNLELHLTICSERVKNVYAKNVYQIQETLFDKLNSFGRECTNEENFFKNLATFDFESICVQKESFIDTDTTKWIRKHIPISNSISSNLVKEPIFLCNSDPYQLVTSFIGALKNLALQCKAVWKSLFFDIETTKQIKLGSILEKLTQRHNRGEPADLDDCDNKTCTSTQFLQVQKKQLIDLQEHLELYCNVLPIFGFNSAKCYLNIIKSYLWPNLLTNVTLNLLISRKRTSLSRPKLVIFSCWILWIFVEAQQVLIPSWRHTNLQRQKDSSPTNALITPTKCRIQNFLRIILSTVNFAAATLLKSNIQTILNYWKGDWPQNKPLSNWNCQNHPLLELGIIITCNR